MNFLRIINSSRLPPVVSCSIGHKLRLFEIIVINTATRAWRPAHVGQFVQPRAFL